MHVYPCVYGYIQISFPLNMLVDDSENNEEMVALENEEKEFMKQYDDWMAQYTKWREDNKSMI